MRGNSMRRLAAGLVGLFMLVPMAPAGAAEQAGDGKSIVYISRTWLHDPDESCTNCFSSEVFRVDLDTYSEVQLTQEGGVSNVTWSPDASQIAYRTWGPRGGRIRTINPDGTE